MAEGLKLVRDELPNSLFSLCLNYRRPMNNYDELCYSSKKLAKYYHKVVQFECSLDK